MSDQQRSGKRREAGQITLEFAFLAPVIILFLFLIVDFGFLLDRYILVTGAAREAARVGAVGASEADIIQRAISSSDGLLEASDVTVSWADANGNGTTGEPGDAVAVRVDYDYAVLTPIEPILNFFGPATISANIPIRTCADMRLEAGTTPTSEGDLCSGP